MKKQILIIGGGDTFGTHEEYLNFLRNFKIDIERWKTGQSDWKDWLRDVLGGGYEIIKPEMPCRWNAKYDEWKLWFEKLIPFLNDGVVIIGHSLGGSFVAKYLSENKFPKKIGAVMLVAAVFDKDFDDYGLQSFSLPATLNLQTGNIIIYHSKDDPYVPFSAAEEFHRAIPGSKLRIFDDRKHFMQEEFPELLEDIKNLD